ncbi:MAG TPA: glycoside hydrolase domain-containing protein [Gemmatimonadaceae bacterium]|jgi:hypothetical protein|nr:glycoside hydrolase domain-containing protein [Gemmatimonadaceae bacterium]
MSRLASVLSAAVLPLAAVVACRDGGETRASVAQASAQVALAAAALTGQQAKLASQVAGAPYLGFDTGEYPGDAAMRAWRTGDSPYSWTGYYLPSPCHQDDGWSGKRETLTSMGYGLAVLYVGQQTWGRKPGAPHFERVKVAKRVTSYVGKGKHRRKVHRTVMRTVLRKAPPPSKDATCSSDFVSGARGMKEGVDAAQRTAREGFARGTTIFLDLERMDVLHQRMRDYYSAWVRAVLDDGRYVPGIYVHTYNANTVYHDVKAVYRSAGLEGEPPFWVAKGQGFDVTKHPTETGHTFAAIWQGILDVTQTWNGHEIPIDVNVASLPSPSETALEVADRMGE